MGAEIVYADAQVSGSITTPANALGSTAGTWAGTPNQNINTTDVWSMANPTLPDLSANTQTITVRARKGSNTGTPTLQVNVYEGATLRQSGVTTNITSTTGQDVAVTFDGTAFTSANDLRVETVIVGTGGNAATRNSVEIDYIRANLDTEAAAQVGNGDGSSSWGFTSTISSVKTIQDSASLSWGNTTALSFAKIGQNVVSYSWGFDSSSAGEIFIIGEPNAVTDLAAFTGSSTGEVILTWSEPVGV